MNRVTIYTNRLCPYCIAARRLLSALGADVVEVPLDGRPELRRELSAANGGWRTVPMIFVDDRFIGGYDDLLELHDGGELQELLGVSTPVRKV